MIPKAYRYYLVRCPQCGKVRIYQPRTPNYREWRVTCPYCGHRFKIYPENKPSRVCGVADTASEAKLMLDQYLETEVGNI